MTVTQMTAGMSPQLLKVRERAQRDPHVTFLSLAHLLDEEALTRAYHRLRSDAAVGVDGITKEQYGQELASNIRSLRQRLREMRWRHQPIRRVHIPKGQGKTRPIGISSIEDKVVQDALREVLEVVYEPVFHDGSYGFRPGRSAHDAIRSLNRVLYQGEVNWILEADIQSYFDSIDRAKLMELLQGRVADGALRRLIGKCLHVGILDGAEYSEPVEGTVQGSVLSPLLGNVYLHYVLDEWLEHEVRPRLRGKVHLVRYADDFVIGFEREDDARRVMQVLGPRFGRYGLHLHPEKTRLLPFGRPQSGTGGKGPATFDFLGFTHYWRRDRGGSWQPSLKTRKTSLRRAIVAIDRWCRGHRHERIKEQHDALTRRLDGHFNYFGVNGNSRCLATLRYRAMRAWHKWLCRRSQRAHLSWDRFNDMLKRLPLPRATVRVQIWGATT